VDSTSYVAVDLDALVNERVDVDDHERHVESL
jgi:hypothetical protein